MYKRDKKLHNFQLLIAVKALHVSRNTPIDATYKRAFYYLKICSVLSHYDNISPVMSIMTRDY